MKFLGKIQTSDSTTITNLNADTLDGKSSEYFAPKASPVFSNEVVISATTAYAGQLRLKTASDATGYGVIFRNDGSNFYLLPTTLNDANGLWNTLRPFYFNLSTGDVTFGNNAIFNNGLTTGGAIYKSGGTAPAYYMSQDGAGRQHWYWNTAGGTSPTFAVAGEDANDLMHTVVNDGSGGYFQFKTASGLNKAAGAAISWTEVLLAHSSRFSYMGNTVWHSGNFIPANYAPLASPTFTGTVTIPNLSPNFLIKAENSSSGEGGQFLLEKASSASLLNSNLAIDLNGTNLRFFDNGAGALGSYRGAYLSIIGCGENVSSQILHSGNFNSYAPTLTGTNASGTWGISVTGSSASCTGTSASATHLTGTAGICGYSSAGCAVSYISAGGPQVTASQNGAAMLTFHRPGLYAVNFGLDIDNKLKVGGFSLNNTSYMIFHEGNLTPLTLTSQSPSALGTSSSVGTLLTAARADHVHKLPSYLDLGLGTSSSKDYPASGDAASTQVVLGNDTRLSNSRPASSASQSVIMAGLGVGSLYSAGFLYSNGGSLGTFTFKSLYPSDVSLGNVDNTSDVNKPISTATKNALNLKADLANPTFTGTLTAPATTLSGKLTLTGAYTSTLDSSGSSGLIVQVKDSSTSAMKDAFELRPNISTGYIFGSKALTVENFNSYAPTLTGTNASGTWNINISGKSAFDSRDSIGSFTTLSQDTPGIEVRGQTIFSGGGTVQSSQPAFMTFHRPGIYAVKFGLDTDNQLKIGGWSMTGGPFPILHSGNFNSYAPTLTGTSASGTWGISVTGNATTVGGLSVNTTLTNNIANQIVRTDGNGYIQAGWISTTSGSADDNTPISRVYASYDSYVRYYSAQGFIDAMGLVYGGNARGRAVDKTNGSANTSDSSNSSGFYFGNNTTGMPSTDWWLWSTCAGNYWSNTDGYAYQLASSFWSDDFRVRRMKTGVWLPWVSLWHSGNFIPANYAPLANPTFTGTLTAPATTLSGKLTLTGAYTSTLDSSGSSGLIVQVKDSSSAMKDAFELRPNSSTGYIFGSKALTVDNIAASDIPTLPVTKLSGITTLSGSNTGDQTITLTGDVTGSGKGSFAATLATISDTGTGNFKKIAVNTKGLVTGTTNVTKSDITGLLGYTYTPYSDANPSGFTSNAGTVTNVTVIAPLTVTTATTTPAIGIAAATNAAAGTMSAADKAKLDGIADNATKVLVTPYNLGNYAVMRDTSGNFSAGVITASLTGNADTATTATTISAVLPIAKGGTGSSSSTDALAALGGQRYQNVFFAAPSGAAGSPSFRSIVMADLPDTVVRAAANAAPVVVDSVAKGYITFWVNNIAYKVLIA